MHLTTEQLRAAYEQALADEERLEQIMIAAEILAGETESIDHIRAFHAAESEYMAAWDRTASAYLAWLNQSRWDHGMRAA